MNAGKLQFVRTDGTSIECVFVEDGNNYIQIMEPMTALVFFLQGLKACQEVISFPDLARYIEARKAE